MWVLLALVGIGLVLGLALRWWALIAAPVGVILISVALTIIEGWDLSRWGGDAGAVGWAMLLSLPALIGAVLGAIIREATRTRAH